jgi:hypothetical protein
VSTFAKRIRFFFRRILTSNWGGAHSALAALRSRKLKLSNSPKNPNSQALSDRHRATRPALEVNRYGYNRPFSRFSAEQLLQMNLKGRNMMALRSAFRRRRHWDLRRLLADAFWRRTNRRRDLVQLCAELGSALRANRDQRAMFGTADREAAYLPRRGCTRSLRRRIFSGKRRSFSERSGEFE